MENQNHEYNYINVTELRNKNISKPEEIIKGLLRGNKVSVLTGGSKAGKSSLSLKMAEKISCGEPFLGLPTTQKDVLYITLDNDEDLIAERLKIMNIKNNTHLDFYFDGPISLGNEIEQDLNYPSLLEVVNDSFNRLPNLGVVFIDLFDNIRDIDERNEYSNSKITDDIETIKGIARICNVAFVLLNHDTKTGEKNSYNSVKGGVKLVGSLNGSFFHLYRNGIGEECATLEVGGRNIREQIIPLKFNFNTLTYSIDNEREESDLDINIALVRNFLLRKKQFSGTLSELCSQVGLTISSSSLGRKIKKFETFLNKEGISFEKSASHSNGRLYIFKVDKNKSL